MRARPDGRVVLFGATGRTGRLAAAAMVRQGLRPVLAGRDADALAALADELAEEFPRGRGLEVAVADTTAPESVRALVRSPGDVLVSTVGPFTTHGDVAAKAAVAAGCAYLDSAWEPSFLKRMFDGLADRATQRGAVLLPAFGCYYVAGSLAATVAARRAMTGSRPPARVDIGYFTAPGVGRAYAPGEALTEDAFSWSGGRMRPERAGARVRTFEVGGGRQLDAISLGTAEHFTVPRMAASITDVGVYVGWFGRMTRAASVAGAVGSTASRMLGLSSVWDSVLRGISSPSPSQDSSVGDSSHRTIVVGETFDADGAFQQRVRMEGPPAAELTASLLSWGAGMLLQGAESGAGVLGPAEAFGTEALVGGCMALGLSEIHHSY